MKFVIERPFTVAAAGALFYLYARSALEGNVTSIVLLGLAGAFVYFRVKQHQRQTQPRG